MLIKARSRFLWEGFNQPVTPSAWSQFDSSLLLRLQRTCRARCVAQDWRRNNLISLFRPAGGHIIHSYQSLSLSMKDVLKCVKSHTLSHSESLTSFSSISLWLMYICVWASFPLNGCTWVCSHYVYSKFFWVCRRLLMRASRPAASPSRHAFCTLSGGESRFCPFTSLIVSRSWTAFLAIKRQNLVTSEFVQGCC